MTNRSSSDLSWEDIKKEEEERVEHRRRNLQRKGWIPGLLEPTVGLALSGGGIRSATFSLGLLRSLSQARLVHRVDYLSTVSGGGYAGAFYCSLFVPQRLRGTAYSQDTLDDVAGKLGADVLGSSRGQDGIARLRQGGYYLTPNGTSDAAFAAAVAVRNWFAVALVSGISLLGLFLLINLGFAGARALPAVLPAQLVEGARIALGGQAFIDTLPDRQDAPWWVLLLILSFWPAACGWAFWFTRTAPVPQRRWWRLISWQTGVVALIFLAAWSWPQLEEDTFWTHYLRYGILLTSVLAFAAYAAAEARTWTKPEKSTLKTPASPFAPSSGGALTGLRRLVRSVGGASPDLPAAAALSEENAVRSRLSRWMYRGAIALVGVASLFAINEIGEHIYNGSRLKKLNNSGLVIPTALLAWATGARWLLKRFSGTRPQGGLIADLLRRAGRLAALITGLVLLVVLLALWSAAAHALLWQQSGVGNFDWWANPPGWIGTLATLSGAQPGLLYATMLTSLVLLCGLALGQVDSLLNQSSLASFYSARLRKAYLGATNAARSSGGGGLDKEHPQDEISLASYYDPAVMAPLHLINVTINETTSKSSAVIQRDRKGKMMSVSPAGYLFPPASPADPQRGIPRAVAEDLPLSSWIGISGAAFTTGAGHQTSLGTAMLATMTNMRLGYWWYREKPRFRGGLFDMVQHYLLRELRASYEGTCARRWYLSDGGHYENSGVYELVRRRIPLIIASDNGADPEYEFADLVNLIRKVRIDFGAEVEFLDKAEMSKLFGDSSLANVFGTLDEIRAGGGSEQASPDAVGTEVPRAGPYATLARIRYEGQCDAGRSPSTLLWIKPRITGRELPDLLQYRAANVAFPQQPTTDQFFDEAQWESYYRLGQLIGDSIFDSGRFPNLEGVAWRPWDMRPLTR